MYKRSSPEALSLAALGRADSKRPDKTCRGITTAGKACRKPLKKGSKDKYCHLHRDQQSTFRSRLLGARTTTVTVVEEDPEEEEEVELPRPKLSKTGIALSQFPTPSPTPSPKPNSKLGNWSPARKPVPSIAYPPQQHVRPPSLQLSPPPSIPPPTPPLSIDSPSPKPVLRQKKSLFKLGKAFRKLFHTGQGKSTVEHDLRRTPSLNATFRTNELRPSRYPQVITPAGLPSSNPTASLPQSTNHSSRPPSRPAQLFPPSPPDSSSTARSPNLQSQPRPSHATPQHTIISHVPRINPTQPHKAGVQRSWETMWVPGIDGLGAHIICKEWLSPSLTAIGRQKLLSSMRAPLSIGEEPGYIYVYKISERTDEIFYKVGRTQNLTRRLYQWSRSCPYTPLLVEFFPSPPPGMLKRTTSASSLSSLFKREGASGSESPGSSTGRIVKCAVTHRIERLIHLELEDRFGRVDISRGGCQCGKFHKEWFQGGKGQDGGWTEVRDVIVRWVGFARIANGEVLD